MDDFPAAHSMDTTWFAVDGEGRVGHAWTGEIGPLPEAALQVPWVTVYLALLVARIATSARDHVRVAEPVEAALLAAITEGDADAASVYADWCEAHDRDHNGWWTGTRAIYRVETGFRPVSITSLPPVWSGVIVFASDDAVDAFMARYPNLEDDWRDTHVRLGLPHALAVYEIAAETFADAWLAGAQVAFAIETLPEPHDLGFYEYEHCFYDRDYVRTQVPAVPLRVAELPAPIRERLTELALPLRFAEAARFEPRDHTSCNGWFDES